LAYETTDRGQLFEDASAEDGYGDIANILTWMDDPSNDHRQIGGWLDEETGREGFHDTGDTFATLTDPRAGGATVIVRINRRGRIVDSYERGLDHGWPAPRHVAEALEPNASPLLAGFLAALAMVLRRNSRSTRHPACVKGE
jgi:hypothetical protein